MLLKEVLLEWLLNTNLFEMAFERKVVINKVRQLQTTIARHFVTLVTFDDLNNLNHWINEIDGYLADIDEAFVKPGTRKLNPAEYYNMLWEEPLGHGVLALNQLRSGIFKRDPEYSKLPRRDIPDNLAYQNLEKLYHKVSYDIANNKFTHIRDYLNILGI